ncbi:hypothetical protein SETIT_2G134100v2 [Setaria italica]|uniref:Uncharacterized protein n=1 Tax=Setaria italica TaxID=4555 RepID=A0A368PZ03_SETIT|nr:hypothetical protein SETIT_2G134100v2 [Setaria italica]
MLKVHAVGVDFIVLAPSILQGTSCSPAVRGSEAIQPSLRRRPLKTTLSFPWSCNSTNLSRPSMTAMSRERRASPLSFFFGRVSGKDVAKRSFCWIFICVYQHLFHIIIHYIYSLQCEIIY